MEKIIQVPFDVPEAKFSLIHEVFFERVQNIFDDISWDNFDRGYWNEIFTNCISPFIRSIRDVNRIINVYRFKYGLMHNETNGIDLLAITTLQVCAPSIYNWIYENIGILSGSIQSAGGITGVDQKKNSEKYISKFKVLYPNNPECMLKVIQTLFPKFSWRTGSYTQCNESNDQLRHNQKIACPDRSEIYFDLSLEDIKVSKQQILATINEYDADELHRFFIGLMKRKATFEYLDELEAYIVDIPEGRVPLFFNELIYLQTIESNYERRKFLEPIPAYQCQKCNWAILKQLNNKQRVEILLSAINNTNFKTLSVVVGMIVCIERAYGRIGDSSDYNYKIIDESQMPELEKEILARIKSISNSENLFDTVDFTDIYILWHYLDADSLTSYIRSKLEYPQNVPKLLLIDAGSWSTGLSSGWTFKEESFSEFISKEEAYQKIISLRKTNDFTSMKLKFKEIAVAYYLWYAGIKRREISKENVDKIVSEWEAE